MDHSGQACTSSLQVLLFLPANQTIAYSNEHSVELREVVQQRCCIANHLPVTIYRTVWPGIIEKYDRFPASSKRRIGHDLAVTTGT